MADEPQGDAALAVMPGWKKAALRIALAPFAAAINVVRWFRRGR